MNYRNLMKTILLGGAAILWAMPQSPPTTYAGDGNCTQDLTGTQKNCDGKNGLLCYSGVKTCGSGTKLSYCKDGTSGTGHNSGTFFCYQEDSNCSGRQYHPVTNTTDCKKASVEDPIELP